MPKSDYNREPWIATKESVCFQIVCVIYEDFSPTVLLYNMFYIDWFLDDSTGAQVLWFHNI